MQFGFELVGFVRRCNNYLEERKIGCQSINYTFIFGWGKPGKKQINNFTSKEKSEQWWFTILKIPWPGKPMQFPMLSKHLHSSFQPIFSEKIRKLPIKLVIVRCHRLLLLCLTVLFSQWLWVYDRPVLTVGVRAREFSESWILLFLVGELRVNGCE